MIDHRAMELMVEGRDLPWLLEQWVQRTPNNRFLIWAPPPDSGDSHQQWTYAQFHSAVTAVAAGLQAQGLGKGDRLLIHLDNCPEYLMAYFACAYLGVVSVLSNTRSVARELAYYCESIDVKAVLTQADYLATVQEAAPHLSFIVLTSTPESVPDDPLLLSFEALQAQSAEHASLLDSERTPQPLQDLRIQFTSGTTSQPKAVLTTHANALFAAQQTALAYRLSSDDVCQLFVPLFHNNGLSTLMTSALWAGGAVLLQAKFSASQFWPVAMKYGATWTSLPGTFFIHALWEQEVPDHCFRFWIFAVSKSIEEKFKVQSRGHWGMTEMVALPLVGDPHHGGPEYNIGRPIPGLEIAIRHEDGRDCSPGETGHLFVRGVRGITLFKEYVNNPEANEKAFDAAGWFDTGDRVHLDGQGNLYFADRSKDMLRVGGENVAASEIEQVIGQLAWVKECAVVGQKHAMLDEVPVAFVSLNDHAPETPEQRVMTLCNNQLADFKTLRKVYVVDDFPRSTLQKIAKHKLSKSLPVLQD